MSSFVLEVFWQNTFKARLLCSFVFEEYFSWSEFFIIDKRLFPPVFIDFEYLVKNSVGDFIDKVDLIK